MLKDWGFKNNHLLDQIFSSNDLSLELFHIYFVSEDERKKFISYLKDHERVIELLSIMGDYDFTCVIIAKDSNELEQISTKIRQNFKDLIDEWRGFLVLRSYKLEEFDLLPNFNSIKRFPVD